MKDYVKKKKEKAIYNQYLLSVTNELSSNLNNKFRSSLVKKCKLQIIIIIPVTFMDLSKFHRVLILHFNIRAHGTYYK